MAGLSLHKDRLLRFDTELVFVMCEMSNTEFVIINQGDEATFEEELTNDVLEIITVFSACIYGPRSQKTKNLIETLNKRSKIHTTHQARPP